VLIASAIIAILVPNGIGPVPFYCPKKLRLTAKGIHSSLVRIGNGDTAHFQFRINVNNE
jgi:hypothetical protein